MPLAPNVNAAPNNSAGTTARRALIKKNDLMMFAPRKNSTHRRA